MESRDLSLSRRGFIGKAGAAALTLAAATRFVQAAEADSGDVEVNPVEDLMFEHGVLGRVLLIFEASMARAAANEPLPYELLAKANQLVEAFIHNYHEKNEEEYLFPRFRQAKQQVELVDTLQAQHDVSRQITKRLDTLLKQSGEDNARKAETVDLLKAQIRMYRPHADRENTILFPAVRNLVTVSQWDHMSEEFEETEHKLFGENGHGTALNQIAEMEKQLGIYDLSKMTAQLPAAAS